MFKDLQENSPNYILYSHCYYNDLIPTLGSYILYIDKNSKRIDLNGENIYMVSNTSR